MFFNGHIIGSYPDGVTLKMSISGCETLV